MGPMWWWVCAAQAAETELLPAGSDWRYLDTGVPPDPSWITAGFDDSAWAQGPAPLGYGLAGLATQVSYGSDPLARPITTWFRAEIDVADPSDFQAFSLHLRRDDGALVYLNGVEVVRMNLPSGAISPTTLATSVVGGVDQDTLFPVIVPEDAVLPGLNVLAVEVHQQSASSPDLVLDAKLSGWDGPTAITRGPYLQQLTSDGAIVRWVTDGPGTGELFWAPAPMGARSHVIRSAEVAFDHALRITGAPPDTLIGYAIGDGLGGRLAGGDSRHVFRTAPLPGTQRPIRVWVLGDSGTANLGAQAVRDAYRAYEPRVLDTDVWLMLGDNAYGSGTEAEYDEAVFRFYPEYLRQLSLWPALGNHDGYSAFSNTQTGPYFDLFTLPTQGEAGGVPSGTEAYWSFDYGNIHFVCLDSYHSDRSPAGAMVSWLRADLAATTADWLIAFFHHPPYSKGSHNSDTETQMVQMREYVMPVLEEAGVDLVMTGHSHSYERSYLIDGHYGTSDTLDRQTMILQERLGDPFSDGPYTKWPEGLAPHEGTIQVVAGSSGQISGGSLDHPVMAVSANELGSLVLDIDGLSLTGQFLDDLGNVIDTFALDKGRTTVVSIDGPRVATEDELVTLTALARQPDGTEPPSYSWSWGDGTPDTAGATASHSWTQEGSYVVTVTVTDDAGEQASKDIVVSIDNEPPVIASMSASPGAVEGSPVTLTALASDPGGGPVTYRWLVDGDHYDEPIVDHIFRDDGPYVAQLVVRDQAGREVTGSLEVEVANVPPVLSGVNQSAHVENVPITLYALVYDPGYDDTFTTTWTMPDGSTVLGSSASLLAPDDGDLLAHLRIEDDDGGIVEQDVVVSVDNQPPTIDSATFSGTLLEGSPLTFVASATDPSPLDTASVAWSFDGTSQVEGEQVVHVFGDQGPFEVQVIATDEDGGVTVLPLPVSLQNVPARLEAVLAPSVVDEGEVVSWTVLGSDPGFDDVLDAVWTFADGRSLRGLTVEHALPDEGLWPVQVELTDDEGEGESLLFEVQALNIAPRITSTPSPLRVAPGQSWTYTVTIEDPDPVELSLAGPAGATLENGTISWKAPQELGVAWPFTLTALDSDGATSTQQWSVVVAQQPQPDERLEREDRLPPCGCRTSGPASSWPLALLLLLAARDRKSRCTGSRRSFS